MNDDCGCCELIFTAEAGVKVVQRESGGDYELVMPSGNRNIWFDDRGEAICCAQVVGSCWLEAKACGAVEERAIAQERVLDKAREYELAAESEHEIGAALCRRSAETLRRAALWQLRGTPEECGLTAFPANPTQEVSSDG